MVSHPLCTGGRKPAAARAPAERWRPRFPSSSLRILLLFLALQNDNSSWASLSVKLSFMLTRRVWERQLTFGFEGVGDGGAAFTTDFILQHAAELFDGRRGAVVLQVEQNVRLVSFLAAAIFKCGFHHHTYLYFKLLYRWINVVWFPHVGNWFGTCRVSITGQRTGACVIITRLTDSGYGDGSW